MPVFINLQMTYAALACVPIQFWQYNQLIRTYLHWVEWNGTDERAKLVTWQSQQTTKRTRLSSRPTSGWKLKLCLRIIWTCCWPWKQHVLDMDGMNAALSLEGSIMWVDTMLLTPEYLHGWVVSAFVSFHQWNFLTAFVCSISLRLSQSVCAVISYLIKTNF